MRHTFDESNATALLGEVDCFWKYLEQWKSSQGFDCQEKESEFRAGLLQVRYDSRLTGAEFFNQLRTKPDPNNQKEIFEFNRLSLCEKLADGRIRRVLPVLYLL